PIIAPASSAAPHRRDPCCAVRCYDDDLRSRRPDDARVRAQSRNGDTGTYLSHTHSEVGGRFAVTDTHRLVDAECAHEAGNGGGHAMTGIRIDIVGAESSLEEFCRGIALPGCPSGSTREPYASIFSGAGALHPMSAAPAVSMSVRGRRRFPLRAPGSRIRESQ